MKPKEVDDTKFNWLRATTIATSKKLHDCLSCVLKRKTLRLALLTASYYGNIDRKEVVRSSLLSRIGYKKIDREVESKHSSFSRKMEVAKLFLCSKLSSKIC